MNEWTLFSGQVDFQYTYMYVFTHEHISAPFQYIACDDVS